jgi:hypothetical protein
MAFVSDYSFYNMTRIGEDKEGLNQRNLQNVGYSNYQLSQFRPDCPMSSAIDIATRQPCFNFSGSHQVGIGGCNINQSSLLQIGELTKPSGKISLYQRPFVTVPYLGRGSSNPVLESHIQQGELANNRKSINLMSEVSYIQHLHTPMIPSLQATITNPANLVEGVAHDGWVRGGLPSRGMERDTANF